MALGWLALAGAIVLLACSRGDSSEPKTGSLEARWIGSDTGKLTAPAVAEWCDSLNLLELRAIHGDTGIALVLYPADSLKDSVPPGDYPVLTPHRQRPRRPSAVIALRWFAETSIRGFRGDSGIVVFQAGKKATRAGKFSGYMRSATEGSRVTVVGSFKDLTVTPAAADCAGRAPEQPEDSGDNLVDPDEVGESADSE